MDALAAKFQDVLAAQARAQQDALAQIQAAASQLSSVRPVVNINSSPRGGLEALANANLDLPKDDGAAARIRGTTPARGAPPNAATPAELRSGFALPGGAGSTKAQTEPEPSHLTLAKGATRQGVC